MMKPAIAILTYNRASVLKNSIASVLKHTDCATAIFEDAGYKDNTVDFLIKDREPQNEDEVSECVRWYADRESCEVYLGTRNIGVAGNSNRALRWFMESTDADFLLLCNDDILAKGDFTKAYGHAHEHTDIGMFCYCPFDTPQYACAETPYRGVPLRLLTRLTGMMMSITRNTVKDIGYFDVSFGPYGEEHCDYTYRAGLAGHAELDGYTHNGIDIKQDSLSYQDAPCSIDGSLRPELDEKASIAMKKASASYSVRDYYRPFATAHNDYAGGGSEGIRIEDMLGYAVVQNRKDVVHPSELVSFT